MVSSLAEESGKPSSLSLTRLAYVKGHCGWDAVTLLREGCVAPEHESDTALRILDAPVLGGLEVGYLGKTGRRNELRLRVMANTQRDWIPMCGGMTQVIGRALVETSLRDLIDLEPGATTAVVNLVTTSGAIPLHIEIENGRVVRTTTIMDRYVEFLYARGVSPVVLEGIEALDVSEYLVFDIEALSRAHPGVEFRTRQHGPGLEIIHSMLRAYQKHRGVTAGVSAMMFERGGEGPGQFRVYSRFYSDDEAAAGVPFEFQCGTGTVAVGIALAHWGLIPSVDRNVELLLEWGSQRVTPDPYGIRLSRLEAVLDGKRMTQARFSHSVVEILAEGTLTLPAYRWGERGVVG